MSAVGVSTIRSPRSAENSALTARTRSAIRALSSADLEPERKVTPRAATGRPSRVITGLAMQLIPDVVAFSSTAYPLSRAAASSSRSSASVDGPVPVRVGQVYPS